MKKQYISPEIVSLRLNLASMIAASKPTVSYDGDKPIVVGDDAEEGGSDSRRRRDIWADEEEEEDDF